MSSDLHAHVCPPNNTEVTGIHDTRYRRHYCVLIYICRWKSVCTNFEQKYCCHHSARSPKLLRVTVNTEVLLRNILYRTWRPALFNIWASFESFWRWAIHGKWDLLLSDVMSVWDADSWKTKGRVSAGTRICPFASAFRLPLEIISLLLNGHRRFLHRV